MTRVSKGQNLGLSDQPATKVPGRYGLEGRGCTPQGTVTMGYYAWEIRRGDLLKCLNGHSLNMSNSS